MNLKHFHDISEEITYSLVNDPNHQYQIKADVNEDVFQNFIDYIADDIIPNINEDNYYSYYELCDEFNVLDLISQVRSELNEYLINVKSLQYCKKSLLLHTIEEEISKNLNEYLIQQGELLMESNIKSLYNIFRNGAQQLNDHNLVYNLIKNEFDKSHDTNIFILLQFLDGKMLSEENLNESLSFQKQRYDFMPKIDFSYISMHFKKLYSLVNKLNNQIHNIYMPYLIISFVLIGVLSYSYLKQQNEINQIKRDCFELQNLVTKNKNETNQIKQDCFELKDSLAKNKNETNQIKQDYFELKDLVTKNKNETNPIKQDCFELKDLVTKNKKELNYQIANILSNQITAEVSMNSQGL